MGSILIQGGRLIDPASGRDETADIVIEGGRVVGVGPGLRAPDGAEVIDAREKIVAPGLIDPHVHLREPGHEHKETIASGTAAAVEGGFATVCCMPNTSPALDSPAALALVRERASKGGACRVFAVCAATVGRAGVSLTDIAALAEAGAVGVSDDGDALASSAVMHRALEQTRDAGLAFMQHCQDPELTRASAMHAGEVALRLGLPGWPSVAEELIIERDVRLNRRIGCRYHVQHLSCAGSVEIVRRARAEGQPVSAEASPHHLLLTHETCEGFDTNAKMNPPLREQADVDAVRQGVADGTITILATDHAPHTPEDKSAPFEQAPFGIIGLETALALYAEALVHSGLIGWPRLIELMTINPARLCNLDALGLGSLHEGGPADVTIIDPDARWTIDEGAIKSKSRNTPFLGRQARGRAVGVIVAGEIRLRR
ncbi:MAG: dihydroorotase [Phycisphaerales bacterium]|nr:MAG: dihydroorotase [Phycisphaerales bacterium]